MKKILAVGYGLASYLLFTFVFFFAIGFIGNLVVPKTIDTGPTGPAWEAILVDAGLLGLFALQHSGMARRGYKQWESRFIHPSLQRSTYVLLASLAMLALFWLWRPIPAEIWNLNLPWLRWLVLGGYALGWGIVFIAPFMTSHTELYGLRQVWYYRRGQESPASRFTMAGFYHYLRHPLQLGLLIAFWSTPQMTAGHLLFALASSGYIFIGTWLEERDLLHEFGETYQQYRERVPKLIPLLKIFTLLSSPSPAAPDPAERQSTGD